MLKNKSAKYCLGKITPLVIFSILMLISAQASSAILPLTANSGKYISAEEVNQYVREAVFAIAHENKIPDYIFNERYTVHQLQIQEMVFPLVKQKFIWIEKNTSSFPPPGSLRGNQLKETYKKELFRGVRDALASNPDWYIKLFTTDESDRIISFHSDVEIQNNGNILVKETIIVYNGNGGEQSSNNEIQRGIVRTIPTRYTTSVGLISKVPFRINEIKRNGEKEPYHTENADNGIVIYFGSSDYFLEPGYYTYTISYETGKQLIFHNDKDEFYWNVTGNGWSFIMEKASCRVTFPEGSEIIEYQCYTGFAGSTEQQCKVNGTDGREINFSTDISLEPWQGLTIAVASKPGIIARPGKIQKYIWLLRDNIILPVLLLAVVLLFLFNYRAWNKYGRDPKPGVVIPQFAPPDGFSPADAGYLMEQKYKPVLFAAALVDMAVKRKLDIEIKKEGLIFSSSAYYFKAPAITKIEEHENQNFYSLYGFEADDLYGQKAVKGTYNSKIASCNTALEMQLENRMQVKKGRNSTFKGLFTLNDNYTGLGFFMLFMMGFGSIIYLVINASLMLAIYSGVLLLAGLIIQIVFAKILSAYTPEGRKLKDHLLGFIMYLKAAEQQRFEHFTPPDLSLQLFEKYLPFAIALGCSNEWAEKFEKILSALPEGAYQPAYIRGFGAGHFSAADFSSQMSSGFSGTISSASTPPSSSSGGSGGGGSSGGGGGGGGGGGW